MEEVVAAEAGISLATLRVEDPEGRPPPRRAISIARDQRLRPLAHDVASEPDPRPPGEFETEAGRLGDGGRQPTPVTGWFEHDEERLRAPGERRQPAESVGDAGRFVRGRQPATGEVEDEQVDRAPGQQHATDGEALVERLRGDDHEPFEADTTGDRLDRVEAARQVEPGHDRAGVLCLGGEAVDERRPAARAVAADRDARVSRQATRPQDGVERREARVDDPVVGVEIVGATIGPWPVIGEWRHGRGRRQRQRADDLRSCRTPSGTEARDSGVHIGARVRHRTTRVEHLF